MELNSKKLGKRLQQLHDLVLSYVNQYDHIWDCCCDHGFLGMALLNSTNANIHFVDVVPHIMVELEEKLKANYSNKTWKTHCLDVASLPIESYPNSRHLVIIAGVGGDLIAELVTIILQNNTHQNIDFLLCPVHRIYTLRQQLIQLDLRLKNEILIKENRRFYEALWITNKKKNVELINPIGSTLWYSQTPEQEKNSQDYLQQTITHYQKVQRGSEDIEHILKAYLALTTKHETTSIKK